MAKTMLTILACVGAGSAVSGCATAQRTEVAASSGMRGTVKVAYSGAAMVRTTVGETYNGLGGAIRSPLRDFNLMQEKIPIALSRAKGDVYDVSGLDSCEAIAVAIRDLDLVLGPDVDTPKVEDQRTRSQKLASAAADSALNVAKGTLDHYIPVRSVVRQVTGAKKYEKEVSRANLAGSVRRGFLKAIGMQQNCAWPAAPISFKPRPAMAPIQLAANTAAPPTPAAPLQVMKVANVSAPTSALPTRQGAATPAATVPTPPVPAAVPIIAAAAPTASAPPVVAAASTPPAIAEQKAEAPAPAATVIATARAAEAAPEAVAKPMQVAAVQPTALASSLSAHESAAPAPPPPSSGITLVADHGSGPASSLGFVGGPAQTSAAPGLR